MKKKQNDEEMYGFPFSSKVSYLEKVICLLQKKKDSGGQKPEPKHTFKITFTHIALIAAGIIIIYSFQKEISFVKNEISYVVGKISLAL